MTDKPTTAEPKIEYQCDACGAINRVRSPIRQMHEDSLAAVRQTAAERDEYDRQRKLYHADMLKVREQRDTYATKLEESLQREIALRAWQEEVAEGLGFLNRAEGQGGYEVAEPVVLLAAWRSRESAIERLKAERDAARANHLKVMNERDAAEIKLGKISAAVENPFDNLSAVKYIREILKSPACTSCGGTGRLADHPCPTCCR